MISKSFLVLKFYDNYCLCTPWFAVWERRAKIMGSILSAPDTHVGVTRLVEGVSDPPFL